MAMISMPVLVVFIRSVSMSMSILVKYLALSIFILHRMMVTMATMTAERGKASMAGFTRIAAGAAVKP